MMDKLEQLIDLYLVAKCTFLIGPMAKPELFDGLLMATGFNVCEECGDRRSGTCAPINDKTIQVVRGRSTSQQVVNRKTNAEYAEELGTTKRQVAKMRKRGELKE